MLTQDPALGSGPDPASSFPPQPSDSHFLNGIPLSDGLKNAIIGFFNGTVNAMHGYITGPAPSIGTREESIHLPSRSVDGGHCSETGRDPEYLPGQTPDNHSSALASEGADLEAGHQTAALGGVNTDGKPSMWKRLSTWMTVVVIGATLLIVVPGLILGLTTGQVQWGIALSGALATVVGIFAGLHYHYSQKV